MIPVIKKFVDGFVKRDGISVLLATLLVKFSGILIAVFVVRLLPVSEYGYIAFATSIVTTASGFAGIGSNWSLLRFGPQQPSISAKYQMFRYAIRRGRLYTLPIVALVVITSFFLPGNMSGAGVYIMILAVGLLTTFHSQCLESYFRILGKNKVYSRYNVLATFILLILSIVLSYFFKGYGYAFAIVAAPLVAYLLFIKHISFRKPEWNVTGAHRFFVYGLYTSLGTIANQVIILLGPVIAGYFDASPEDIAHFRVATIIPFNLIMIPLLIMTTDFVHFSKNSRNTIVLREYYFDYLKTISMISVVPFLILIVFNRFIIVMLFGESYAASVNMSVALTIGVMFSFLFRIPLGNMLAAVGKADWNVAHTIFWLIMFVPMSYYGYQKWGMTGIAITISTIFIFSGFIALFLFLYYLKITNTNNAIVQTT